MDEYLGDLPRWAPPIARSWAGTFPPWRWSRSRAWWSRWRASRSRRPRCCRSDADAGTGQAERLLGDSRGYLKAQTHPDCWSSTGASPARSAAAPADRAQRAAEWLFTGFFARRSRFARRFRGAAAGEQSCADWRRQRRSASAADREISRLQGHCDAPHLLSGIHGCRRLRRLFSRALRRVRSGSHVEPRSCSWRSISFFSGCPGCLRCG